MVMDLRIRIYSYYLLPIVNALYVWQLGTDLSLARFRVLGHNLPRSGLIHFGDLLFATSWSKLNKLVSIVSFKWIFIHIVVSLVNDDKYTPNWRHINWIKVRDNFQTTNKHMLHTCFLSGYAETEVDFLLGTSYLSYNKYIYRKSKDWFMSLIKSNLKMEYH